MDVLQHGHVIDHMAAYLVQSRANSTNQKYVNCFKHFDNYCKSNSFQSKPASPIVVAMYVTYMLDQAKSYSVISAAVYAIKWLHSLHGFEDPTCNSTVKHLLDSARRLRSGPVHKKDVIDSEMLQTLCGSFSDSDDVITLRDLAIILIGYAGFMRFNELSSLCCSDITFHDDHFIIDIRSSKTDIYREGKQVPISKGNSVACPYAMLQKYMKTAGLSITYTDFLFKPCYRSKGVSNIIKTNQRLSYVRVAFCQN